MGNDVRAEYPDERQKRHWNKFFKPVAWGVLIIAAIATFIGIQRLMEEGESVTAINAEGTEFAVGETMEAEQQMPDTPGTTTVVTPDEIPAAVPGEGKPVLPPGTTVLPRNPLEGGASSSAGGLAAVAGQTTGLAALIGDQEPAKYIGKPVVVYGAYVQRIIGDRAFTIGPSATDFIIVQYPSGTSKSNWLELVQPGRIVAVEGTLRLRPTRDVADKLFLLQGTPELGKSELYIESVNLARPVE